MVEEEVNSQVSGPGALGVPAAGGRDCFLGAAVPLDEWIHLRLSWLLSGVKFTGDTRVFLRIRSPDFTRLEGWHITGSLARTVRRVGMPFSVGNRRCCCQKEKGRCAEQAETAPQCTRHRGCWEVVISFWSAILTTCDLSLSVKLAVCVCNMIASNQLQLLS